MQTRRKSMLESLACCLPVVFACACGPDADGGAAGNDGGTDTGDAGDVGADSGLPDQMPPGVQSQAPAADAELANAQAISVTFTEAMEVGSITTGTAGSCSGSVQLSADGFASCAGLDAPTSTDDETFVMTPTAALAPGASYALRVTTDATDRAGNALLSSYEGSPGFTVRYLNTIDVEDGGANDFDSGQEEFATTETGLVYISFDDDYLYLGLAHSDILLGGGGNKFLYFLLSTDPGLTTGSPSSSDGKAIFGAGGDRMMYHWKEQIDGGSYSEYRTGVPGGWAGDWGTTDKQVFLTEGYVESRIAWTELGGMPSDLIVTSYTIDYDGDNGNGFLYNLLDGAVSGSGATPRDIGRYVHLQLPADTAPNDASNILDF